MNKLIIIGMDNPQGNPALSLDPPNGSGYRLWQLASARTGITPVQWEQMTDRRNLCADFWRPTDANKMAAGMMPELHGQVVLLLGMNVSSAFGVTAPVLGWHDTEAWLRIPHPSGQNRWYNDDANRAATEIMLADVVDMLQWEQAA